MISYANIVNTRFQTHVINGVAGHTKTPTVDHKDTRSTIICTSNSLQMYKNIQLYFIDFSSSLCIIDLLNLTF